MPQLSPHSLLTLCVSIFTMMLLLTVLLHTQLTSVLEKSTNKRSTIFLISNTLDVISPQEELLVTADPTHPHVWFFYSGSNMRSF